MKRQPLLRHASAMSIGDILMASIRRSTHETSMLRRAYVLGLWEDVAGKSIAARTQQIFLKDKKLFVELSSSTARNEAFMQRDEIVRRINEQAQAQIVSELILR